MRAILLFTCLSISNICFAQIWFHHTIKQTVINNGFILVSGTSATPLDLCTDRSGVVTVSGGFINVDLWQIKNNVTCGSNGIDASKTLTQLRILDGRVTYGQPTKVLVLPFQSFTIGLNSLPFRFRPEVTVRETGAKLSANGTSAFQLGLSIGYTRGKSWITTRGITNWSWTLGPYFGPSTADLKKETVQNPSTWTINQIKATLTYGLNLIFARNNLGLVFAYGYEKALGTNGDQWIYQNKPYFGIGINTSFMK
jgi:hypothetical protein